MQSSIVHKLLAVISVVSDAPKPLSFSEIVEKTGMNKSTIHRLLAIAVEERMLRHEGNRRVYLLGSRVFDFVRSAYKGYDIQAIALDEMVQLYERFDVNVTIGVPGGHDVIYLRILESPRSMGGVQRPGMRDPIHCSASGKALMAFIPDRVAAAMLNGYEFRRHTARTITSLDAFTDQLREVRELGFGWNDREEHDHFLGISAPVFNYLAEPIAVLNIWSAYPRHSIEDFMGWSDTLKASAAHVTEMIGGVPPDIKTLSDFDPASACA
ncbi:MAG: IclR family transcriptional regulator [Pseudomonadota bacterium]